MTSTDTAPAFTQLPNLPGHFYFTDLNTTDVDAAAKFYAAMFGWNYTEIPDAPNRYLPADIDGRGKAALSGLSEEQRAAGLPPHWFPYLWVSDLDATLARIPELGGSIEMPAMDVFDMGRMAMAVDPTGARFGLWQDAKPGETTVKGEHGSPFWYELHTSDVDGAIAFYRELVGWSTDALQMGPDMTYHLIVPEQVDDEQANAGGIMGMMQPHRESGEPSRWFTYFNVDDCEAAHARALELGATSVMEPHDIPGAGRSCWVSDPQGALIALMKPDPRQA